MPSLAASPRLLVDRAVGSHARFRRWTAPGRSEHVATRSFRPSAHAAVEIAWLEEGALGYGVGSKRHDVVAGGAMLVASDVEHVTDFPSAMRGAALWVDRDLVAAISDAMGVASSSAAFAIPNAPRLVALARALESEAQANDRGAAMAVDALLEAILVVALRAEPSDGAGAPARDPGIARAVRFVEESYADDLDVASMAKVAGMSRFHFSRRFRELVGTSPYRHLVDVRLAHAATELRRGRSSVTRTAFAVGFSDASRFARMFRAKFGMSPARYASVGRGHE